LVVFTAWIAFISWTIIAVHQRFLFSIFFEVLLPGRVIFSEVMPLYTVYERTVLWIGVGITVVSVGLGFLGYLRKRKLFSFSFFTMTVFLIPLLAIASVFRFSSQRFNVLISHRFFEFGYIAVGAFSALFFVWAFKSTRKASLKVPLIWAVATMIIVGPIMGAMHPRTFSRVSDTISFKALYLNKWVSESKINDEYTVGDRVVYLILSIYGESEVARYPGFFASQDFDLPWDKRSEWLYVVTYVYMTDFYGPNATRFAGSPHFNSLYTNGLLNVYGASNHTSP
jgi:hypothetical protein